MELRPSQVMLLLHFGLGWENVSSLVLFRVRVINE